MTLLQRRQTPPRGLDLPARKDRTRDAAIETAPLPALLRLALRGYGGVLATPCVRPGRHVLAGEPVASWDGPFELALHASASGRIRAVTDAPEPCIELEVDGAERQTDPAPVPDWANSDPAALRRRLAAAGVVGLGGAGFPAAAKAVARPDDEPPPIDLLIGNGVESEPFLTADDRLLRERAASVFEGLAILARAAGAREVVLAIADDKPEALAACRDAAAYGIRVVAVSSVYPSGSERQLVEAITGRKIVPGRLPRDAGVLCHNVATASAASRAVSDGHPLTRRITTVTGSALARPGNLEVRLGTPVADLLAWRGLDETALVSLHLGGPLTGFPFSDRRLPITATRAGLLAAAGDDLPDPAPERPCIRCDACAEACVADLQPQELLRLARAGDHDGAAALRLAECIECGACDWVCPSRIPLVAVFRDSRRQLAAQAEAKARAHRARLRHERRRERLERERAAAEKARSARLSRVEAALARARARKSGP